MSSLSSFCCTYIPTTLLLRGARIAVILLLVFIILLLLRNSLISLHQSSNFIRSLLNYPESSTMFFGIPAYMFLLFITATGASATNISSMVVCLYLLEASSVICKDPSCSNNALILFVLLELILVPLCSLYYICFVPDI